MKKEIISDLKGLAIMCVAVIAAASLRMLIWM